MKLTAYETEVMNMSLTELEKAVRAKANESKEFSCYFRKTPWKVKSIDYYTNTIEMEETHKLDPHTEVIDFKHFLTQYSKW